MAEQLILFALGIVIPIIAHRLGIGVPGLPTPVPTVPVPVAAPGILGGILSPLLPLLGQMLTHLLQAKAGDLKLSDHETELLSTIRPVVDAILAAKAKK